MKPHECLKYRNCSAPKEPYELVFHNVTRPEVRLHTHDFMELFWMQEGRCIHMFDGKDMELAPNDFGIVTPDALHGFKWIDERSYRIVNLAFSLDVLMKILKRHCLEKDPLWGVKAEKIRIRSLSTEGGAWLDEEFMTLRKRASSKLALEHFLLSLIMKISPSAEATSDKCPPWLRDACMLMSRPENFHKGPKHFESISGRTLAHVSRVLRESTGKTPVEWITDWRMGYAADKLSSASMPIHEIATECGFSSLSRFYSVFTGWHGTSPNRYRMRSSHVFPGGR
ncbi:MAG: AraC family transcriptional regulator [Victivallales bacterium]|jgi:AraC family cel operon transcriptional repressor